MSDKGERPGADFVEIVLGGMPVTILRKVSDHIHRGDPALQERIMIVFGGKGFIQKKRRVAEPVSGIPKQIDRKSTRLNSSHGYISYAVFCLKKKNSNIVRRARRAEPRKRRTRRSRATLSRGRARLTLSASYSLLRRSLSIALWGAAAMALWH